MAGKVETVAKKAGVSIATVSRVINNLGNVSHAKVQMVENAFKELGYDYEEFMRISSRSNKDIKTIAMITLHRDLFTSYSSVYAQTVYSIERTLNEHKYSMVKANVRSVDEIPPIVAEGKVDGIILSGRSLNKDVINAMNGIPMVWVTSHTSKGRDHALPGNEAIGRMAANYLFDRGHREMAVLSPFSHQPYTTRVEFFEFAATRLGAQVSLIMDNQPTPGADRKLDISWLQEISSGLLERLLTKKKLPTGLFVPNDLLTGVLYRLMLKRGIRPGFDFDFISCNNDITNLAGLFPMPATIDIGAPTMGCRAVEQLLWRIDNPANDKRIVNVVVEPVLIKSPDDDLVRGNFSNTKKSDD